MTASEFRDDIYATIREAMEDEGVVTPVVKIRKVASTGLVITYRDGSAVGVACWREPKRKAKKR